MDRNYVLRDSQGHTRGYITRGFDALNWRLKGLTQADEFVLFFGDGTCVRRDLAADVQSGEWKMKRNDLTGAMILNGNEVVADSGLEAQRAYQMMLHGNQAPKEAEDNTHTSSAHQTEQKALIKEEKQRQQNERRDVMQRRWPPPPCLSKAVYRSGVWKDEGSQEIE